MQCRSALEGKAFARFSAAHQLMQTHMGIQLNISKDTVQMPMPVARTSQRAGSKAPDSNRFTPRTAWPSAHALLRYVHKINRDKRHFE
jgi:hypothetical protein